MISFVSESHILIFSNISWFSAHTANKLTDFKQLRTFVHEVTDTNDSFHSNHWKICKVNRFHTTQTDLYHYL